MKVLHTESSTGWGGQENRILQEAIQMRSRGVDVLFACRRGAKLGQRARELGFPVDEFPMRNSFDPVSLVGLARAFRRHHVDVVNTHSGRDTLLAGIAARLIPARPRIVRTRHLILPITSKATYSVLPDHVVCVSRAVQDYLAGAGVPAHMLSTVPTGVDTARFDPTATATTLRAELGIAADVPLIGTVAILRMKKGYQDLVAAIPRVLAAVPDAHFVFAGDGPQRQNIEHALAVARLGERVHLLGLTGLLVPAHDPPALAAAIVALASDPVRRRTMGAAGRRWVLDEYTVQKMAERMHAVYERVLA